MNLNPLKNDNTDALVKALEDANNASGVPNTAQNASTQTNGMAGQTTDGTQAVDSSVIASDPQIVGDQSSVPTVANPAVDATANGSSTETNGITFDGNDLPEGLSSDANAHINTSSTGGVLSPELDIVKKSALEQLRPLIEKLDLEPADKFDKYLMMLRASDDPALIKPAFDATQGIVGEKEKAQALLDIINEINYITANQT